MNYKEIWNSLEQDALSSGAFTARQIYPEKMIKMYLVVDCDQIRRSLLIDISDKCIEIEGFPLWKGLSIQKKKLRIENGPEVAYIMIGNNLRETNDIYESVISNIVENLKNIACDDKIEFELKTILAKWQFFFEKYGEKGLSPTEQKGLYGELWILRNLLGFMDLYKALHGWTGVQKTNHDFQYSNGALEMKTTSAKQHQKVHISSEKQLDDEGLPALFLALLVVNEIQHVGESLPKIVKDLRRLFSADIGIALLFEEKIQSSGYLDVHESKYTSRYVKRYCKVFKVQEGFPRIIHKNLPNGIGDISYSVAVSACKDFEVEINSVMQLLTIDE